MRVVEFNSAKRFQHIGGQKKPMQNNDLVVQATAHSSNLDSLKLVKRAKSCDADEMQIGDERNKVRDELSSQFSALNLS